MASPDETPSPPVPPPHLGTRGLTKQNEGVTNPTADRVAAHEVVDVDSFLNHYYAMFAPLTACWKGLLFETPPNNCIDEQQPTLLVPTPNTLHNVAGDDIVGRVS